MIRYGIAVLVGTAFLLVHLVAVRRVIEGAASRPYAWGALALVGAAPLLLLRRGGEATARPRGRRLAIVWVALLAGYAVLAL